MKPYVIIVDKLSEFYLSIKAQGGVVYDQYTTAQGCSYAQHNATQSAWTQHLAMV